MLNSIKGLFGKKRRKNSIHPAYFEALESRQLLSASNYAVSDFQNSTWHIVGQDFSGDFLIAANAASITSGTLHKDDGTTLDLAGAGFAFTTGAGKGIITLSYGAQNNPNRFEINARLASTDDYATGGDSNGLGQAVMVRQPGSAFTTGTSSELLGTWSLAGDNKIGSMTIGYRAGTGLYLAAASLRDNGAAVGFSLARSTVTIDNTTTGHVVITLNNSAGNAVRTYEGYITDAGDFIGLKNTTSTTGNDMLVALKVGTRGSYSSSDLVASSLWSIAGDETNGRFILGTPNSKGVATITGSSLRMNLGNDINGSPVSVNGANATGTLSIDRNGRATLRLTFNPGSAAAVTITLTGQMNATKNSIALLSADGSTFMILTTNQDHPAEFLNGGKTIALPTSATNQQITYTYDELAAKAGYRDIDQDPLPGPLYIKNTAGVLVIDNVTATNGTWVAITSSSNIKWTSDTTVSTTRATPVFSIAQSNTPTAAATVTFTTRRVTNAVNVTVAVPTAVQPSSAIATNGVTAEYKLTRAITSQQDVVFTFGGTGVYNTDYTVAAVVNGVDVALTPDGSNKFTATFPADAKSLIIKVVPKYISTVATSRTVILTLATPASNSGYELGTKTTATVSIAASPTISVRKSGSMAEATQSTGQYIISRTGSTAGALTVTFTLGGTSTPGTDYTITGATLVDANTHTYTALIAAGRTSAVVSLKTIKDNLRTEGTETVDLTVASGPYTPPVTQPTSFSITDYTNNTGPTLLATSALGSVVTGGTASITYANLTSASHATDAEGDAITFTIASVPAGVTLTKFDASNNSSAVVAGTTTLAAGERIEWTAGNAAVTGKTLFTFTAKDALGKAGNRTSTAKINVTTSSTNAAPTINTTGTVTGKTFVNDNTTTTTVSVANLASYTSAADDKDAASALTFRVTNIPAGVTLTIGGVDYTSASTLTNAKISGVQLITVKVANTVTPGATVALFSVKAVDTDNAESTATAVISGKVGQTPSIQAGTVAGTFQQNAAATSVTFANLVTATSPTDDGASSALTYVITAIQPGVTLTIGGTPFTSASTLTSATITTGQTFTVAVDNTVAASATAPLFSVKVIDADSLQSSAVAIAGNVTT